MVSRVPPSVAAPDAEPSPTALLLVDVINHFEFPDGKALLKQALPIAPHLARLKRRARAAGIPVIYVNDNFGRWRSNFAELLSYCLREEALGRDFVSALQPDHEDYLILKPKHSAFYQTPLDTLLSQLKTNTLIIGGVSTTSCILSTALDANMRELRVFVPADCSAACARHEHRQAIAQIGLIRSARTSVARSLRLEELAKFQ